MLIDEIASAIAAHEGWFSRGSRPERNHNPGNLTAIFLDRSKDADGFVIFESRMEGIAALYHQIAKDMTRGKTLREFITKFAPPGKNDTNLYIQIVADEVGIDPDEKLWTYLRLPRLR